MIQPAIVLKNLTKQYYLEKPRTLKKLFSYMFSPFEKFTVIKNFSLTVNKGESVLITGPNGSGKTTILKLIAGITQPDSGIIQTHGKIVPLIELGAGFNFDLSGRENIIVNATILGIDMKKIKQITPNVISFSGLHDFIDIPVKRYSTGMLSRLAFSIAIHSDPDILLLDEVFAVGDQSFIKKSINSLLELKAKKKTIVFVSHYENFVEKLANRKIQLKPLQKLA